MQWLLACLPRRPLRRPPQPPPSSLTHLPTELLSLALSYLCLRALVTVALADRRLYLLLRQPAALGANCTSVWKHYSPVHFTVGAAEGEERCVAAGSERFTGGTSIQHVLQPLFWFRHVGELRLLFRGPAGSKVLSHQDNSADPIFTLLPNCTQLRSLEIRGLSVVAVNALVVALNSLPLLQRLELNAYEHGRNEELTLCLLRLCTEQLYHCTVSRRQLYELLRLQPHTPLFSLRSLAVTPAPYHADERWSRTNAVGDSFVTHFPNLERLDISCDSYCNQPDWDAQLPPALWAYLLTPTSPPAFAQQLTQLTLRVDFADRLAAAALLPALPAMYPSLTRLRVGVLKRDTQQKVRLLLEQRILEAPCAEWDAAVYALKNSVGAAWDAEEDAFVSSAINPHGLIVSHRYRRAQ